MRVTCPSCSKVLQVPDSAAGKRGKCPACGAAVQIPDVVELQAAPDVDEVFGERLRGIEAKLGELASQAAQAASSTASDAGAQVEKMASDALERARQMVTAAESRVGEIAATLEAKLKGAATPAPAPAPAPEPAPASVGKEEVEALGQRLAAVEESAAERSDLTASRQELTQRIAALEAGTTDRLTAVEAGLQGLGDLSTRLATLESTLNTLTTRLAAVEGNDGAQEVVRTQRLVLTDGAGKRRAVLSAAPDGSVSLGFLTPNGIVPLALGLGADGSASLNLYDAEGNGRACVRLDSNGLPAAALFDESGTAVWHVPE